MAPAELEPAYLISGADRPKVELAVRRLRGHFDPTAVEILSASEVGGADAVASCNAMGLFGEGRRLVLVSEVERWKADDVRAVADYLKAPAPDTVLALVGEGVRKDSPLAKACAKSGQVLLYEVQKRDLARWLGEQLARRDAKADPEALRALIATAGDDPGALAAEADKLALWADGTQIDVGIVEQLAAPTHPPIWSLTDAWGRRDVGGVLRAAQELIERSSDPRSQVVHRIALAMIDQVRLVSACRRLRDEGLSPAEAAKRLKRRSEYPVRKAYGHLEAFDEEELRSALVRLAELDRALKGGSRLPGELELQRALADVTRPRARSAVEA
jgi:DNA polymerase III delta subunit